jgi:hypothetical protein
LAQRIVLVDIPELVIRLSLMLDLAEEDFGPASESAIKYRIRSARDSGEAALAIATSPHR